MPSSLFDPTLDVAQLAAILRRTQGAPLLPPLGGPEWNAAFAKPLTKLTMERLRPVVQAETGEPLPELTDELYAEFHLNGRRIAFEDRYFERRFRLSRAAVCAMENPTGLWLDSFLAKLWATYEEPSWAFPAHVKEPSGKDPRFIDLFVADTSNTLAEFLTVFGDLIPQDLTDGIRKRLHRDVFERYLEHDFWWWHGTNNWNAACHHGVLGSALALCEDTELLARMLLKMREGLPVFLEGFTCDGGTSEGPGYWSGGFGRFAELNRHLETRTRGECTLFADEARIREIAKFGPRVTLSGNHRVNFSDCPPSGILSPGLIGYLGDRLDEPLCRANAAATCSWLLAHPDDPHGHRGDFLYLSRLFLYAPSEASGDPVELGPMEDLLPDLGVAIVRGRDGEGNLWEFAAKAGHNDEHHNQNDCGSYLLHINGTRLLVDLGSPEYEKDFFGPKRYTFLTARSLGHSVPLINGVEQGTGREFESRIVEYQASPGTLQLAIELAGAYPPEAHCAYCVRTFVLDIPNGTLDITDQFELTRADAFESAIMTGDPVEIRDGNARVISHGGSLTISPAPGTEITAVQEHEWKDHDGYPALARRIVLEPAKVGLRGSVGCRVTFNGIALASGSAGDMMESWTSPPQPSSKSRRLSSHS